MIGKIEGVGPQLEILPLGDRESSRQRQVELENPGAFDVADAEIAKRAHRRSGESCAADPRQARSRRASGMIGDIGARTRYQVPALISLSIEGHVGAQCHGEELG